MLSQIESDYLVPIDTIAAKSITLSWRLQAFVADQRMLLQLMRKGPRL
jgi:hypothetical protein